ncbi:hypothetical protein ABPG72_018296 [Tetrahymena utriculariae]
MAFVNPLRKLSFQTRGWITLASGFALHFVLGTFYLWGSISTYTTSYLRHDGQNYTKETVGAVFPFTFLALNIGTPFGVYLARKIGFNLQIFIGSVLIGLSTIISSFVLNIFPLFVLFYGFVFGILNGLLYMLPFNSCYLYLPHRKGLVSGVIVGGFGFGSTAFIWLIYSIVNPHNEKPSVLIDGVKYFSKDVCDKFPEALRVLGLVQMAIGVLSCFIHIRPTEEELKQEEEKQKMQKLGKINELEFCELKNQKTSCNNSEKQQHEKPASSDLEKGCSTEQEVLQVHNSVLNKDARPHFEFQVEVTQNDVNKNDQQKEKVENKKKKEEVYHEFQNFKDGMHTKYIYISISLALMFTVYGSMIVSNYKLYGEYNNYDDNFLSTVGTVGSIFNGLSRVFWGSIMEKLKIEQIIIINLSFQIIVSFTFRWAANYAALYLIYIVLAYFFYGGWFSVFPTLSARIFGKKIGTQIYGVTFLGFSCASFIQYFVVMEVQNAIGWGNTFWVFTVLLITALIIAQFVRFNADPPIKNEEVKQIENQTEYFKA